MNRAGQAEETARGKARRPGRELCVLRLLGDAAVRGTKKPCGSVGASSLLPALELHQHHHPLDSTAGFPHANSGYSISLPRTPSWWAKQAPASPFTVGAVDARTLQSPE